MSAREARVHPPLRGVGSVPCPPMIPDAVKDFGTIPVMPVLCGRCGKVLDEMSVDPVRGWVFYRPPNGSATRIASRRPRVSLRGARRPWRVSGDGEFKGVFHLFQ